MPIEYIYNTDFSLINESKITSWLKNVISSEDFLLGELVYAFFNDDELKAINAKHLKHDFYTDVISFNETTGKTINGNIAISIERVLENSKEYNTSFEEELQRVMVHGLLHLMGYNDKTKNGKSQMNKTETKKIKMFHMEQ
jgi:probable rRNA maturation factor